MGVVREAGVGRGLRGRSAFDKGREGACIRAEPAVILEIAEQAGAARAVISIRAQIRVNVVIRIRNASHGNYRVARGARIIQVAGHQIEVARACIRGAPRAVGRPGDR